jgi:hypothetical protein
MPSVRQSSCNEGRALRGLMTGSAQHGAAQHGRGKRVGNGDPSREETDTPSLAAFLGVIKQAAKSREAVQLIYERLVGRWNWASVLARRISMLPPRERGTGNNAWESSHAQ